MLVGTINKYRYELIEKAFSKLDPYHTGEASIQDIFAIYDGSRHPDVAHGKITPEDANADFRETFEMHHNTIHDYNSSAPVTREEFVEYFSYMSSMCESDQNFDQMLTGPFNLDNKNCYESMPYAGTPQAITNINAHEKWKHDHHRKMFYGNEHDIISPGNQHGYFATTSQTKYQEPVNYGGQPAGQSTWPAGANPTWQGGLMDEGQRVAHLQEQYYNQEQQYLQNQSNEFQQNQQNLYEYQPETKPQFHPQPEETHQVPASPTTQANAQEVVQKVRNKLKERGARGFVGFRRVFSIADDNRSLTLDRNEFSKVFRDYRLDVTPEEMNVLFNTFDTNNDGSVNFDEFLRHVVGELNPFREQFVRQAFQKLDRDGSGVINKYDVTGVFDPSQHPDVREGKKTPEEVLSDFLDTFEIHYSATHPGSNDDRVTYEEFKEYYNNISANIDNDEYFQLMITNAWKLDQVQAPRQAWAGQA